MIRQEILIFSSSLNSKNTCQSLDLNNISDFVEKFYLDDFIEQKKCQLKFQLQHYKHNMSFHLDLQDLSTISYLCQILKTIEKFNVYYLID